MDSFDVSLAQHRKALAKYMEEWTHQQELLMARYVAGTAHAPLENVICEREEDLQKPAGVETNSPKESGEPIGERRTGSTETLESIAPVSSFSQESSSEEEVAAAVRKKTSIEHSRIRKISKEKSGLADDSALESGPWPALKSIVESSRFMVVVSVVIVCNVIFMAITSDLMLEAVKKNEDPNRSFMNGGEAILTCAYVSELLLKLAAYGKYFFVGREWRWNLFDLFIVLAGLSDLVAPLFAQGATINVYYLRVSRIFRLIKMLRVVKFYRAFKELRLIIESILGCLKTMFWTVTLLTTVKFLISLFFIQGVTDYLRSHPQSEWDEGFIKYWGSTSIAMVSLFQPRVTCQRSVFPLSCEPVAAMTLLRVLCVVPVIYCSGLEINLQQQNLHLRDIEEGPRKFKLQKRASPKDPPQERSEPVEQLAAKEAQPTGRPSRNATAAEMTGVEQNGAGDLNAFVAALITNVVSIVVFFVVASVLRRRYPLVYSKNTLTLKDVDELKDDIDDCPADLKPLLEEAWDKKVPFQPEETFFGWWFASADVTIDQVVEFRGLDQAMLLEFAHTAMKILAAIGVPLVFVLGPCHCFLGGYRAGAPGTAEADYLSYWGLANVVDGHPWLYKAHAIVLWFILIMVQRLIYNAMREFMKYRNAWLKALPSPRSTTVLVEGIPEAYRHDDNLKKYFDVIFGKSVVKKARVVKDTQDVLTVVKRLEAKEAEVEKLRHAQKQAEQVTEEEKQALKDMERDLEAITSERAEKRSEVLRAAEQEKDSPVPVVNLSKGFVTFETRRDAELAKMMMFTPSAEDFIVSIPPDPTDIIYTDLQKDPVAEQLRMLLGFGMIGGVFWAYLPAVVGIAYFTSIETLGQYVPALHALAEDDAMVALWDGMVNALALQLFIAFVPTFFVLIFKNFFVLKAEAWLQHRIQEWYFYFQVVFILLVTAIGSSLMNTLEDLAQNPLSIFALLAETLPMATHFYLNFLPLQWVTHAQNLMRMANLFKFKAFTVLFGKAVALRKAEPEDQDYYGLGSRSARFTFMLTLTLAFCSLSPLIVILGFVNFWICRKVYGYLCVFCETKKADLGGVFYVSQLCHVQQGLYIYVILMTGVLLERDLSWWPGVVAAGGLVFLHNSYSRFKSIFRWESLSFQELLDIGTPKDSGDLKYEQPELVA